MIRLQVVLARCSFDTVRIALTVFVGFLSTKPWRLMHEISVTCDTMNRTSVHSDSANMRSKNMCDYFWATLSTLSQYAQWVGPRCDKHCLMGLAARLKTLVKAPRCAF